MKIILKSVLFIFIISCFYSCEPGLYDDMYLHLRNNTSKTIELNFLECDCGQHSAPYDIRMEPYSIVHVYTVDYGCTETKNLSMVLDKYITQKLRDTVIVRDVTNDEEMYVYTSADTTMYQKNIFRKSDWTLVGSHHDDKELRNFLYVEFVIE
ncbi:MAG: hypothetical protein J6P44_09785 [Bacteroidales bacterium]|nr:hypothetical protein [Bacteroidales bacterium]